MKPEHKEYILNNINRISVEKISKNLDLKERKIRRFLEEQKGKDVQINSKLEVKTQINKKTLIFSFALIAILGFISYSNSFSGQFIWDDKYLIEKNNHITNWSYMPQIFTEDIVSGAGRKSRSYRPIQTFTYMIDYYLWKLNPAGYHFTSILLHILAAISLYGLIYVIFKDNLLALLTGIFFVVHPVHTEAVTYISGRADSLALLFMLLCFLFYIKSLSSKSIGVHIFMLLSYTLALLSRESSVIFPALLLLYHYSFKKKLKGRGFFSILSLVTIYILIRSVTLKVFLSDGSNVTTLFQRLPGFFVAITSYIKLLFLPFNLHMEYGIKLFHWGDFKVILGVIILLALLIYAFRKRKSDQLVFFSLSWFLVTLLPVSNLFPINAYMAEHWLYLPSIGFFLIFAKVISSLHQTKDFRIFAVMIAISLLTFYSYLTIRQNVYWKEPISFYKRTLKYAPDSARANYNLGIAYKAIDQNEEAIASYKKAIEIDPDLAGAYYNLGLVYRDIDKNKEAAALFKKAIEVYPDYAQAYNNLGVVYVFMNKNEEAVTLFKKAIEIKDDYADAYSNFGVVYVTMNRNDEAIALYKKAIKINPNYAVAYHNLGIAYNGINKKEEAIASYKRAIEIKPDYTEAHDKLKAAYDSMNKK